MKTFHMKTKVSEKDIQDTIRDYLRLKGWYVMRLNSGSYNLGKSFVRGVDAGTPDLMAFSPFSDVSAVKLFFIEVKVPGKNPSTIQISKMDELEEYGAICIVAHSVEEVKEAGL
jgi:hypothetical protein